ncbi:HGxxPAAW family protein [Streptomyces sp. NPDC007083]|uniref:HGxxPAAW family protein n=1 Tax=unclassified Streptomyces TaxID=2593676 RepID=UPI0033C0C9FE
MAHSHGHTPAAWTGSITAFVGFCVASAFTVLAQPVGVIAGLVVIGAGAVIGGIMRAAGMGQSKSPGLTAEQAQAHRLAHEQAHRPVADKAHS